MKPTPQEARARLAEIDAIVSHTRKQIGHGIAAPLLILWGCIWLVGYSISQFQPHWVPIFWPTLGIGGGLASALVGWRRETPTRDRSDTTLGLVWLILAGYAVLWIAIFIPPGIPGEMSQTEFGQIYNRKIAIYLATVPMFAYMVAGLWLGRFLTWLGLTVTLVVALSYFLLTEWSLLITGVVGGSTLILSGVFIRKLWR